MTLRAVIEMTDTPTVAVMTRTDEHDTWRDVDRAVIGGTPSDARDLDEVPDRSDIEHKAKMVLAGLGFVLVESWEWDPVSGDASAACVRHTWREIEHVEQANEWREG